MNFKNVHRAIRDRIHAFIHKARLDRENRVRQEKIANFSLESRYLKQVEQLQLIHYYRSRASSGPRPTFREVEFSNMSQHGEDGLLLYVFALIGVTNRSAVEICAGDGMECNTANLIVNHGWWGLLMDGNPANTEKSRRFYAGFRTTRHWPPISMHAWVTVENVNELIRGKGIAGEIDLLSLDIDGIDYFLWQAITVVNPRVVILEFNHLLGPTRSATVPYKADFVAEFTEFGSDYAGASLTAFVKLGRQKGYRLAGTNAIATNAIFIRNDVGAELIPEISADACFSHPRAKFGMEHRYPLIKDKPWMEI